MLSYLLVVTVDLLALYFAVSMFAVGLGVMLYGSAGARAVAHFVFTQPLLALGRNFARLVEACLRGLGALLYAAWDTLLSSLVDPTLILLGRALRRLLFPRRP